MADNQDQASSNEDSKPASAPVMRADGGSTAILNNQIEILPSRPLPHFNRGPVKAYAARPRGESGVEPYFAMICEPHLVPRSGEVPSFLGLNNASLVRLVMAGPVYWPPSQSAHFCFIFENKLGQPIMPSLEAQGLGWRPETVLKTVVRPMVRVLSNLRGSGIFHGDIRPTNMFDGGQKVFDSIILGGCLSLPPSYIQPVLFETIERGMRDPIARGKGTVADDLYSFGASIAVILRRKDVLQGKSDQDIVREKIEQGSYNALMGKERVTGPLFELLRGLLYDDRDQRWTLDEVTAWLEGEHINSKQSLKKRRASRPLTFNTETYDRPALIAMDLQQNQSEAIQLIETDELGQWIARSLEDGVLKSRFEEALTSAQELGHGPGYHDRLLSRISIVLDPEGPIRYKGLNIHPDGLPYALAEAFALKKDLQPFAEMIGQGTVMYWLSAQTDPKIDTAINTSSYDNCRTFLRQVNMGYGIERCLYFLGSDVPCMSDYMRRYYVRTPEDVLYAFEAISKQSGRPGLFIDRHIAAFLWVKDKRVIEMFASDLNAREMHKRIRGNIKVLATIQKKSKMEMLPGLSEWVSEIVTPLYDRFHDRDLRASLRKRVEKVKTNGNLLDIVNLFDNYDLSANDYNEFKLAMADYQALQRQQTEIEEQLERPDLFTRDAGRDVAAIVSGFLSAILILGFCFLHFVK